MGATPDEEEGRLTRGLRPLAAAIVGLALALGAGLAAPWPAAAWSPGACPTSAGVTVVVDFGAFGAGTATRCVAQTPSSGLAALAAAGFSVTPVTTQPGFVCRIDQRPAPNVESCATTPPGTAYWSYWTAPRGGSWRYSPVGAAASRPAAGSVEGWSFVGTGGLQPPTVAPPAAPAATPPPTPRPTARPTPTAIPRPTPRATAEPLAATPVMSPSTGAVPPSAEASASTTASASVAASADATASTSGSPAETAASATETPQPSPSPAATEQASGPLETAVGVGLVAVVGGAALAVRRRGATGRV